jgi:hypothetical protein
MKSSKLINMAMDALAKLGIQKADGSIVDTDVNFGNYLPRKSVMEIIGLTRKQNVWMNALTTKMKSSTSGTVLVRKMTQNVTEGIGENDGTRVTTKPANWQVPYVCKKYKSETLITTEELKDAADGGVANFERDLLNDFTLQLGNDMADIIWNSDASLDDSISRNRMLNMFDGAALQLDSANVHDAQGQVWGQGIWSAMQKKMPEVYRRDPNLNWLFNDMVNIEWHKSLTNVNTTEKMRSALGDRAISTILEVPPLGKPQLVIPQLSAAEGPAAIAPTSAADDGDGTITLVLTTMVTALLFATAAAGDGRQVKVTCKLTGVSETLAATNNAGTLELYTAGSLGQDVISTTNTDYLVEIADETSLYYMNPKGIYVIHSLDMRSFRWFNKDFDRLEITTYFHMTALVPVKEDKVKFKRVTVPVEISW